MDRTLGLEVRSPASIPLRRSLLHGALSLYWLGQAGFLAETPFGRLLIDPYLSDTLAEKYRGTRFPHERMTAPPVAPEALRDIDAILVTHGHTDHLDPGTIPSILAANPSCRCVVPASCREKAVERGVDPARITPIDVDGCVRIGRHGAITVFGQPSAHEERSVNERGEETFLGYIVEWTGLTVYHSGDCVPYPGLEDRLRAARPDIVLLPVNGRDAERRANGVPGNFTLAEAVELADRVGAGFLIGHHFDMFAFNTIDRTSGERWLEEIAPRHGARLMLARRETVYEWK